AAILIREAASPFRGQGHCTDRRSVADPSQRRFRGPGHEAAPVFPSGLRPAARLLRTHHARQLDAPDLSAAGQREGVEKADDVGHLVIRKRAATPVLDLLAGDDRTFDREDAGAYLLTENLVW